MCAECYQPPEESPSVASRAGSGGASLAVVRRMVISLFPTVMGFKIEDAWRRNPRGMVRCTARFSRPLLSKESERIGHLLKTPVHGLELVQECRRDAVEDWKSRLLEALAGISATSERRAVAVGERRRRSTAHRVPSRPEPAA